MSGVSLAELYFGKAPWVSIPSSQGSDPGTGGCKGDNLDISLFLPVRARSLSRCGEEQQPARPRVGTFGGTVGDLVVTRPVSQGQEDQ